MSAAAIDDWREQAACAQDHYPDDWFPSRGRSTAPGDAAKAICNDVCPVREQCLADALAQGVDKQFGIWGGMTARERRQILRRKLNLAPALGTERRLRALARLGWSSADIATALGQAGGEGCTSRHLGLVRSGRVRQVGRDLAEAVEEVYARLSDRPSQKTISAALARRNAVAAGWPCPDDWSGLDIDDPRAEPHAALPLAA